MTLHILRSILVGLLLSLLAVAPLFAGGSPAFEVAHRRLQQGKAFAAVLPTRAIRTLVPGEAPGLSAAVLGELVELHGSLVRFRPGSGRDAQENIRFDDHLEEGAGRVAAFLAAHPELPPGVAAVLDAASRASASILHAHTSSWLSRAHAALGALVIPVEVLVEEPHRFVGPADQVFTSLASLGDGLFPHADPSARYLVARAYQEVLVSRPELNPGDLRAGELWASRALLRRKESRIDLARQPVPPELVDEATGALAALVSPEMIRSGVEAPRGFYVRGTPAGFVPGPDEVDPLGFDFAE